MALIGLTPDLTDDQKDIVAKLKEALAVVEDGKVHTFGIVLCMADGPATVIGGRNAASLNIGLDHLKMEILQATFDVSHKKIAQAASTIIKPKSH